MNKIIIENGIIKEKIIDNSIRLDYCEKNDLISVNNLEIKILNDTKLVIYYQNMESIKINVSIDCLEGVCATIYENYYDGIIKIRNNYNLNTASNLSIQKIYDVEQINQFDVINLDGRQANVNYVLKTVSTNEEKYNLLVNHNCSDTTSNIINNAINVKNGKVVFDISGVVPKEKVGCSLNQNNRIVTFNENKCQINPNLLIDENDVSANHSAFIGKFSDEQIFYLQSRGITYNETIKLLTKGFLCSNLHVDKQKIEELEAIIKKYWG